MRTVGTIRKRRPGARKGKATLLFTVVILTMTFVMAVAPPLQAGLMQPFASPMTSGNACSCHYNMYIGINNSSMPSQLLVGQSGNLYVNVSLTTSVFNPAKPTYWLADITVTVTSTKGYTTVLGSPQVNNSQMPFNPKKFVFNLTGKSAGQDVIKVTAKLLSHHMSCQATDTVQGNLLIIKPKEAPVLSSARVTPSKGFNQTVFTFAVKYTDTDADLPVSIAVIIDGKAPRPLTVTDGNADNILYGEDYSTKVNGSTLGLGNHSFKFTAADNLFQAIGDNGVHPGPKVDVYIAPNKPPTVVIVAPISGSTVRGVVNITGTAVDPDKGDKVQSVEVNVDNSTWVVATGTANWHLLWDFTNTSTGPHAIFAKATDGENFSKPVAAYVHVERIIRDPPTVTITGGHYIAENIMEVKGTSAVGNNSGPVELVSVWADPIDAWSTAERKGAPLGNGTPSYDTWRWIWNTSEVDAGNYTLNARAVAWSGALVSPIASADVTVVKVNHAPMLLTTEPPDPVTMYEGGTRIFKVTAGDRDKDFLTYKWTFDTTPKQQQFDPLSLTYKASYTSAGTHEVEVVVSDGHQENASVSFAWHLTVLKGFIVTDLTVPANGPIDSGASQAFNVTVFDPEGGKMTYAWSVDGVKDATGIGPDYGFMYESQTTQQTRHTVALKVQNSQGQSKDLSWTVDVKGRAPIPGPGTGDGNHASGIDALVIPWLMVVLVVIAIVFALYVGLRRKKESEPSAVPPPAPDMSAMPPMAQDPATTQAPPALDQAYYQYQPQDQYQGQQGPTDQPPQWPPAEGGGAQ